MKLKSLFSLVMGSKQAMSKKNKTISEADDLSAITWESERLVQLRKTAKTAWIIASISIIVAVLYIVAIVVLTPLKKSEPFVVRVDNATGIVDVVEGLQATPNTYDKAVTRYFVARYIRAREGYSRELAPLFYERVGLMSSTDVGREYAKAFAPDNPNSPLRVLGSKGKANVKIISISFISDDQVSVRFVKETKHSNRPARKENLIATMKFHYSNAPMKNSQRLENPLGFQVDDYRLARESIGGE